jgi:hypothetical protein
MSHGRWAVECPPAGPVQSLFSRENAKEDVGPSPVRLTGDSKAPRVEGAGAGVGNWGVLRVVVLQWSCRSRRSPRVWARVSNARSSRTVADGRARSQRPRNAWHSRGREFDSPRLHCLFAILAFPQVSCGPWLPVFCRSSHSHRRSSADAPSLIHPHRHWPARLPAQVVDVYDVVTLEHARGPVT